jgi:hypothetical protein
LLQLSAKLIINNAKKFDGKLIVELYTKWKIKHFNSSPYRPEINDVIEAANKKIKKII